MRVATRLIAPAAGAGTGPRRIEGGPAFGIAPDAGAVTASGGTAPAATLAGLDAILTLQGENGTPEERRRRAAKRGHDLLDGLDRLKAALLSGRVGTADLQAVAGRLSERAGTSGDPRLDGLVADIELRAAVEVAKLAQRRTA